MGRTGEFKLLQKFLKERFPEAAAAYTAVFHNVPRETDAGKLESYYKKFCLAIGIESIEPGERKDRFDVTDRRQLFIATVIYIYNPGVMAGYTTLEAQVNYKLSRLLNIHRSSVCRITDQAIFLNKQLPEFRQKALALSEIVSRQ